eukprot:TRINITY_DN12523_c0_g1_i1.p1 TRINITY_DN12523_c0_g1~~TRINITY_DN12523_c0_g1_i1.p1  ORF type:complete len:385 (-),score=88.06 TRINITY_DN12523_c0_g1_i1:129-1283(-)
MVDKSELYINPSMATTYPNEKELFVVRDVLLTDKKANLVISSLTMKITTHRVKFVHEKNVQVYFEVKLPNVTQTETETKFLSSTVKKIRLFMSAGYKVNIEASDLTEAYRHLEGSRKTQTWLKEVVTATMKPVSASDYTPKTSTNHPDVQFYSGLRTAKEREINTLQTTDRTVASSFTDFDSLFVNNGELKDIIKFLTQNLNVYDDSRSQNEKNELDSILAELGCFQIVTRDEAGDRFYDELAKQLWTLCQTKDFLERQGGIISLIDVYYLFNKTRATCMISPNELLKTCKLFEKLRIPLKLSTFENGIKVIQSTTFNQESDFQKNIKQHVDTKYGITLEQLAKKSRISLTIARVKLEENLKSGRLVIDRSIEGDRYFLNTIWP